MIQKKNIDLTGKWNMYYMHHKTYLQYGITPCCENDIRNLGLKAYDATVPGDFFLDLMNNGEINDPYFGDNILELQEYEDVHIFYVKKFNASIVDNYIRNLVFEGIDVFSEIFLNGEFLIKTDNMMIPYEIELSSLNDGENEIFIHIYPTMVEAAGYSVSPGNIAMDYNYASLNVRKPAHMFGWDIAPRIVQSGIWRPVYIESKPLSYIDQTYLMTISQNGEGGDACVCLHYSVKTENNLLDGYTIRCKGKCGVSHFEKESKLWYQSGKIMFNVHNAKLWWPKGLGEQNLYNVEVELCKDGKVVDRKTFNFGIRTVTLINKNAEKSGKPGEFLFKINDEKVFIKGTNWVPADAFHSRDAERIPALLDLVDDIGCNAVRCWGGNVYENDLFFDICDKKGILVWQDFGMACGTYPQSAEFQEKLRNEVQTIVRLLRQHPSLIVWAGDNECDLAYANALFNRDPNDNVLTRKVIPEVLYSEDPTRPYLPSSPYIDKEAFESGTDLIPEDHLWGPRDYFKSEYYLSSKAIFASEIGYHGCPSVDSIRKFISEDRIFPPYNDQWYLHATSPEKSNDAIFSYRIALMAKQIKALFGNVPSNIEDYVIASQISQAEADKFFIERFRIDKWNKTGIIWWNIADAWPQFSDAVVDYYLNKKLAYHFIKRSQADVCLICSEPENNEIRLVGCNDSREDEELEFRVFEITNGKSREVCKGKGVIPAQSVSVLNIINYNGTDGEAKLYAMEWITSKGEKGFNHYLAGKPPFDFHQLLRDYQAAGIIDMELPDVKLLA